MGVAGSGSIPPLVLFFSRRRHFLVLDNADMFANSIMTSPLQSATPSSSASAESESDTLRSRSSPVFGESPHGDDVDGAGSGGDGGGGVAILDVGASVHESKSRSFPGSPSLPASPSVGSVGGGVGNSGSSEIPPGSPLWPADATGSGDSSSSSGSTNVNAQRARALQALVDTLQMQRMEAETGAGKAAVQRVVDEAATNNARLEDAWSERPSPFVVQSVFCIQSGADT